MNTQSFYIPQNPVVEKQVHLSRRIGAVVLRQIESGAFKVGPLRQLSPGAVVEVCGDGYNERTKKVRQNGDYYFVFQEDLDCLPLADSDMASAGRG